LQPLSLINVFFSMRLFIVFCAFTYISWYHNPTILCSCMLCAAISWLFIFLLCAAANYSRKGSWSRLWSRKGLGDSLSKKKHLWARDKRHAEIDHKINSLIRKEKPSRTRLGGELPWVPFDWEVCFLFSTLISLV